ncbi:hypothetical protein HF285_02825 [Acidithiobacillus ferrooxidans F221]|uniref:AlbA family DNA-binding domain-containing protein n=1 Tax=Acidithiobacillus ferrooxidans TaxID=920 RepID=UPI001C066242|nr:RNA-binding domain-containing protein [Acidithiobacillus ferrooxidans]MBU2807238.1 hypothetical protein [Acidithiobacillus ferrooxidans F221]
MSEQRTLALIDDLLQRPAETSWVEFKENNADAQMIGKLISALSNAARLADQPFAYVLWGVRDGDHAAVSTTFEPSSQLQQGQPLDMWLAQRLQPAIAFNLARAMSRSGHRRRRGLESFDQVLISLAGNQAPSGLIDKISMHCNKL